MTDRNWNNSELKKFSVNQSKSNADIVEELNNFKQLKGTGINPSGDLESSQYIIKLMAEQATLQDNEEEEDSPTIGEHDNERDEQS